MINLLYFYSEHELMRTYCTEALQYGEQRFSASTERHITVILNPAASDG